MVQLYLWAEIESPVYRSTTFLNLLFLPWACLPGDALLSPNFAPIMALLFWGLGRRHLKDISFSSSCVEKSSPWAMQERKSANLLADALPFLNSKLCTAEKSRNRASSLCKSIFDSTDIKTWWSLRNNNGSDERKCRKNLRSENTAVSNSLFQTSQSRSAALIVRISNLNGVHAAVVFFLSYNWSNCFWRRIRLDDKWLFKSWKCKNMWLRHGLILLLDRVFYFLSPVETWLPEWCCKRRSGDWSKWFDERSVISRDSMKNSKTSVAIRNRRISKLFRSISTPLFPKMCSATDFFFGNSYMVALMLMMWLKTTSTT